MEDQDCFRKNIFWNYHNIKNSLENDLNRLHVDSRKIFNDGVDDIALRFMLSFEKNKDEIGHSMENLYVDIKTAFGNIFNYTWKDSKNNDEKFYFTFIHPDYSYKKEKHFFKIDDAYIIEDDLKIKKDYTSSIGDIISSSEGIINNIATVMAGKLCNSYGIKDRKPKRLWKWQDRMDYLEFYLKDNTLSTDEKEQLKELRSSLQKNRYLKFKRKNYFKRMDECLTKYYY